MREMPAPDLSPPARGGLVIEGVTGAGKSSVIAALMSLPLSRLRSRPLVVHDEDETFGEFMDQPHRVRASWARSRMDTVLDKVRQPIVSGAHLLERFHPSFYALMPGWSVYERVDTSLAVLGFGLVMLTVPERDVSSRCLDRADRSATNWRPGMVDYFGTASSALDAIVLSQRRRLECLTLT